MCLARGDGGSVWVGREGGLGRGKGAGRNGSCPSVSRPPQAHVGTCGVGGTEGSGNGLTLGEAYVCCMEMRTTVVIQDDLFAAAKRRAADRKSNVSAIVNEALRASLKGEVAAPGRGAFQMPTFRPKGGIQRVDTTPLDLDDLMVAEDLGGHRK